MTEPRIEIVIDELVLRGVAPQQADVVATALEARLAVLALQWAEAGAGARARDESVRRLPAVVGRADRPADLGDAVAGRVLDAAREVRR